MRPDMLCNKCGSVLSAVTFTCVRGQYCKPAPRPIHEIAADIRRAWPRPYFGAVPYLDAMRYLGSIADKFGADDASSVIAYFLSNARTWKGEDARTLKAELNALLKSHR